MQSNSNHRRQVLGFAALVALSLALWFYPLLQTIALATGDDRHTHAILAFTAALTLLYLNWSWDRARFQPNAWAWILLSAAIAIACYARWGGSLQRSDAQLSLNILGLVLWWLGSFLLCFGTVPFRRLLFPLLFLLWIVPIPNVILEPMIGALQRGSALSAQDLFWISRTPVALDGLILFTPSLELEVAPECSSIRSSLILVVTTMVLAQALLRSTEHKVAMFLFALPLSVLKNGLRIFTIGWLAEHVDLRILDSPLHHQGGVVFFSAALLFTFLPLWLLRRSEQKHCFVEQPSPAEPSSKAAAQSETASH